MTVADLQPTLTGARVRIRPLKAGDWKALFAAASDPVIWGLHPARDRYTEPVFREFFDEALRSKAAFVFIDRATKEIIGSSRYHGFDPAQREIEIGWTFLTRPYWGGEYNREIKALMLDHAFGFADVVVFYVGETNLRSQRAMTKIGGVRREAMVSRTLHGTSYRHIVFEIRKPGS
jgi:RimJ/RimL family protein N-acetyltransferase